MAQKRAAKKAEGSKQVRGGIAQKVQPDEQLAAVVGKEPLTRADLTKKMWEYVKSNDLQDAKDRRAINADAKLRPIFGKDQVSMFEMTKLVNQHVS
jgi:upstream activation factor subunit UAF30